MNDQKYQQPAVISAYVLPGATSPAQQGFAAKYGYEIAIAILIVATRLPLLGNYHGEPDTARYAFGLRFWIARGPDAGSIINSDLSVGYYWFAANLATAFHVPYEKFPLLLSTLSFIATFPFAFALFDLGTVLTGRRASMVTTVLVLMAPSVWWAGVQGHPQILAAAAVLGSMLAFVWGCRTGTWRLRAILYTAATVLFAIALLIKSDFILLAVAYPFVCETSSMGQNGVSIRSLFRYCRLAAVPIGCGYILLLVLRRAILHGALVGHNRAAAAHVMQYLGLPVGLNLISQATPILFSHGIIALLFAVVGAVYWSRREQASRQRMWLLLVVAWSLLQYSFWLVIRGNNVRHLLLAPVPLFWLSASYLCRQKGRAVVAVVILVLGLDFCIPPNSGANIFPSPNVPVSVRLLRHKENELRTKAHALLIDGETDYSCYFGLYTIDHVSAYLLEEIDKSGMHEEVLTNKAFRIAVRRPDGSLYRNVDVLFASELPENLRCGIVESTEYLDHLPQRYFGSEWTARPLKSLMQKSK